MSDTDMKELITVMVKPLVDDPDAVSIREVEGTNTIIYQLSVAPDDMGRVIGKRGQVANALRVLLRAIAGKEGRRLTLEIVG